MKNRVGDFALFMLFILIFCFASVSTAPIVQSFDKFFTRVSNKCELPRNIKPFAPSARGWYFLTEPLSQCNGVNTTFETNTLCAEIFESFINTTCTTIYSKSIPKISYPLSSDVCTDFAESVNIVPKIEGYVGGKLADRTVCQLACASKYEILCKVLLWSYQIRNHIVTALNADPTENQNNPKYPAQSPIDLKPVTQDHNDLKSSNKAQDEINAQQQESIGNPNGVSSAPINAGVENENGMLHDPKLTDEIAKKVFDDQRRLIPDFGAHDEETQGQTASPQMKVEVVSSTVKDLPISGSVDNNKKTDNVEVTKTNEIVNEQENGEAIQLSSPRNDDMKQDIEVTVTKNQNATSIAEIATAKKIAKEKLKLKIKEKLKKPETTQGVVVNDTNLNPEINVGENTIQVETNENLPNNEDNQLETKNIPSPGNDRIDHVENDPSNKLDHETLKDDKEEEKVEDTNLNAEKLVSSSSSTTHNPVKDEQLHSVSDVSVTSNSKVSKPSDQLYSPSIPDNKVSTSETGIKSTVENQGKSISLTDVSSDVPNLEATTLEVAMEGMDDANEIPPPVQGQDQFNDLENGDTEGEYDRPDYAPDGALPPSTENRKVIAQDYFSTSEKTSMFNDQQNDFSKLYDDFIPKSIGGQVPEDIRRIPPFPEEEDGHFFFYFLSIILILMIGYLLFHNKQKIIALIVEGRHERRRRSYGAGYKKLETK